jgi:hypothetical protein
MNKNNLFVLATMLLGGMMAGCQPRTPAEKVKDKLEDATHETDQAIERTGDRVKDATK